MDYYYDDTAVIEEHKAADDSLLALYRYGDRLLSLETETEVQYYHNDALGSTVDLTDDAGTLKVSYELDPWGHITNQVGTSVNRHIFTSQETDENTGLIYFGARYYDPDTARFITQDTYLGESGTPPSLHRYLYAYSNPLLYIDLLGNAVIVGGPEDHDSRDISDALQYEQVDLHIVPRNKKWERIIKALQSGKHMSREAAINYLRNMRQKQFVVVEAGDGYQKVRRQVLDFLGKDFENKYVGDPYSTTGQEFSRIFDREGLIDLFLKPGFKEGRVIDISEFWNQAVKDFYENVLAGRSPKTAFYEYKFPRWVEEYQGGAPPSLRDYYRNKAFWNSISGIMFPLMFTDLPFIGMLRSEYIPEGTAAKAFNTTKGGADLFESIRGLDISRLKTGEIGSIGENIAKTWLRDQGYQKVFAIQNASGHGLDIIAISSDGRLCFFEVKTTATQTGRIGDLSIRQANMNSFVENVLRRAYKGKGHYRNLDQAKRRLARELLRKFKNNPNVSGNVIGIDLYNKILRVSRWARE